MRSVLKVLSSVGVALMLAVSPISGVRSADLGPAPATTGEMAAVSLREALSHFLSLEMIRATFDVVERDELASTLEQQARRWSNAPPSAAALADLDRQLLAEGSYYIVSLSYLVQVGGAVFPGDKAEMVYANDTVARLDQLQRDFTAAIEESGDVLPILTEVERIRALTEGLSDTPEGFGVFGTHESLLDTVLDKLERGTPA